MAIRPVASRLLCGVLISLPLGGCQAWNSWLDFFRWKGDQQQQQPPVTAVSAVGDNQPTSPDAQNRPSLLIPRIYVFRITLPIGAFSANEKIWPQLNEDALDSKTSVMLAQNGIRAAGGVASKWPGIAKLLDVPGASTEQLVYQTDGKSNVFVATRPGVSDQIVVSVDRDLKNQGRTFDRCDNGFSLAMATSRSKPDLAIQLEPVCMLPSDSGMSPNGFVPEETFPDLRMAVTLNAEQFLVLSPMDHAGPFSVGALWLSDRNKVPATETILVFVPTPNPKPATLVK
jgi:hypothetical protein